MRKLSAIFSAIVAVLATFFIVLFFLYRQKFLGTEEYDPALATKYMAVGIVGILFSLVWLKVSKRIFK